MIHIDAENNGEKRDVPFFLTLEEWVARSMPRAEYFLAWSVGPSVIMGRHQDAATEIDASYCLAHGIGVYRRRSGGGCVYADRGNVMLSFILPGTDVTEIFPRGMELIAGFLRHRMGLPATVSGRNDVLVDGRKVSGSAFQRLTHCSIVHATMLVDVDMDNMLGAITPSRSKLARHGVTSVEARITTLSQLLPGLTAPRLAQEAVAFFCDSTDTIGGERLAQVERLAREARLGGMEIDPASLSNPSTGHRSPAPVPPGLPLTSNIEI